MAAADAVGSAARKLAQIASMSEAFCASSLAAQVHRTRAECWMHGRGPPATVHSGWVDANDLEGLGLVDHHVHGVSRTDDGRAHWEAMLTESHRPQPTAFDSQVGLSIRRWCAPILDLPKFASLEAYYARRPELAAQYRACSIMFPVGPYPTNQAGTSVRTDPPACDNCRCGPFPR